MCSAVTVQWAVGWSVTWGNVFLFYNRHLLRYQRTIRNCCLFVQEKNNVPSCYKRSLQGRPSAAMYVVHNIDICAPCYAPFSAHRLLLHPQNGKSWSSRNVDIYLPKYMAWYWRSPHFHTQVRNCSLKHVLNFWNMIQGHHSICSILFITSCWIGYRVNHIRLSPPPPPHAP